MADTKIEWADIWHDKTASKRLGIPICLYLIHKIMNEKYCWKCKKWRTRTEFCIDPTRGDGRNAICMHCRRKRPINWKPKDRNLIYRQWYAKRGFKSVRARVYARKRKIRPITQDMQEVILEEFEGKCAYCGKPAEVFDHLYPVKLGGDSLLGNLVPACKKCNSSKRDKDLFEWSEEKGMSLSHKVIDILSLAEVNGYGYYFN